MWDNYIEYIYIDKRIFANGGAHEKFTFSFVDMLKYKKFKHDIEVNNKLKTNKETYQILLKGVQEDINKLRKQSEDELNQAMDTMKEVDERINPKKDYCKFCIYNGYCDEKMKACCDKIRG